MSAAGVISGTPTTAGSSTVMVTMTDALGATADRAYVLDVDTATFVVDGPAHLVGGQVGSVYTPTTMHATGGSPGYLWSATGLPAGITMSMTGELTGTPTTAGTSSVVVYSSDSLGAFADAAVLVDGRAGRAQPTARVSRVDDGLAWRVLRQHRSVRHARAVS